MSPLQLAQQIKHLLERATWSTGSQDVVFGARGSVAVFAGEPNEEQIPAGFPWALVGIDNGEVDPEDPGLITQRFTVTCAAEVAGDRMGEHAIIGGAAADIGRSAGRGVGEVAERVRATLQNLTGADGATILLSQIDLSTPTLIGRGRHLAMERTTLSAVCTSAPYFAPPQRLVWDLGKWKWGGAHCSARFDFYRYRLVRKFGRDYSRTPADGTVLYTGTTPEFVGVQNDGYTYTVFADYNSRGAATVEGSSNPEVGAFRVV